MRLVKPEDLTSNINCIDLCIETQRKLRAGNAQLIMSLAQIV